MSLTEIKPIAKERTSNQSSENHCCLVQVRPLLKTIYEKFAIYAFFACTGYKFPSLTYSLCSYFRFWNFLKEKKDFDWVNVGDQLVSRACGCWSFSTADRWQWYSTEHDRTHLHKLDTWANLNHIRLCESYTRRSSIMCKFKNPAKKISYLNWRLFDAQLNRPFAVSIMWLFLDISYIFAN